MSHFISNYHHHDRFCLGSRGMHCHLLPTKPMQTPKEHHSKFSYPPNKFRRSAFSKKKSIVQALLFESWTKQWTVHNFVHEFLNLNPFRSQHLHTVVVCVCVDPVEQSTKLSKLLTKLRKFTKNWDLTKNLSRKLEGLQLATQVQSSLMPKSCDSFQVASDPLMDLNQETLASLCSSSCSSFSGTWKNLGT